AAAIKAALTAPVMSLVGAAANIAVTADSNTAGQMVVIVSFIGALDGIAQNAMTAAIFTAPGAVTAPARTIGGFGHQFNGGFLSLGSDAGLGSTPLTLSSGTIWADTAARTIATPLALSGAVTLGGRRDYGGTNSLTFTGPATLVAN